MLTVWGRKTSSNVQALMWCIGELGLRFSRHDIGHKYGGQDTPEFLAMNPNGTVPVLKDRDGEPLWETGAILRYLSNRYGGAPFWPQGLEDRTHVDKWAEWSKINIALNFTAPIFWRVVRTAPSIATRPRSARPLVSSATSSTSPSTRSRATPFSPGTISRSPTSSSATCFIAISTSQSIAPTIRPCDAITTG
jgi:glutathione S-transferase